MLYCASVVLRWSIMSLPQKRSCSRYFPLLLLERLSILTIDRRGITQNYKRSLWRIEKGVNRTSTLLWINWRSTPSQINLVFTPLCCLSIFSLTADIVWEAAAQDEARKKSAAADEQRRLEEDTQKRREEIKRHSKTSEKHWYPIQSCM